MKILFAGRYNYGNTFTGPEKVARRIYEACSRDSISFQTAFVNYFFDGNKYGIFKKLFGKEVLNENNNCSEFRLGLFRILLYAFKFKPDIIHLINYERFAVVFFLYRLFRKVKIIYNVHGIAVYENSINPEASGKLKFKDSICEKIYFDKSDILIFLSGLSKKTAQRFYKFSDSKTVIIPNGIDREFHIAGKRRENIAENNLKIVFIGDINKKEKGFSGLISALNKTDFSIELYAVSNALPDQMTSEEIIKNDKISFHVISKMDTGKYAEFLSDKDIYISASFYEQFSIAAVESMAAGLVPVVSADTGMLTFIKNGVNGFVYNNETELISVLTNLNSDRESVRGISEKAKLIYEDLNMENIFKKYKDLYL